MSILTRKNYQKIKNKMLYQILKPKLFPDSDTPVWKVLLKSWDLNQVTDYCSPSREFSHFPFIPTTGEDYEHVDWNTMLLNDWTHTRQVAAQYPGCRILGLLPAPGDEEIREAEGKLLGFDILDEPRGYSLLRGIYEDPAAYGNPIINSCALLDDRTTAYRLKDYLRETFGEQDWHCRNPEVWAVFRVDAK